MKQATEIILFTAVALVLNLGVAAFAQAPAPNRPAILIDNWGVVPDLQYMKQLQAAGFEVDAIRHHELTWERLKQYNALVLLDFPQEGTVKTSPEGGPASGPNLEQTLALADKFLAAGGGVMSILIQHGNNPEFYNTTQKALARWGARRPLERVVLSPDQIIKHPRLGMPFFYTANVAAGPVSDGVKGVWYPLGGYSWQMVAGPIDVDATWNVVLRAPNGSRTEPIPLPEKKPGVPYYDAPFVRPGGVTEPALFAIRDLKPGRLALFHASPKFHFESGLSWVHNGAMLDQGLEGKPSDFGKLLANTFHWLAEPSLASGQLGGAKTPADRWARPLEKPNDPNYQHYLGPQATVDYNPSLPPPAVNLLKGMIGPRTAYSGGQGTVVEYAAEARKQGLSFLVFLEDMAQLTPETLAKLVADCKANSGPDLLLLAGYRIKSNLGNQYFQFGAKPLFIHDKYLSPDKKTLMLQPQNADGTWDASRFIDFVFESDWDGGNSMGWFDFTGPMKTGGMAVHDLRLFSMVGVMLYKDGKLVEDVTDQFLLTNAGTLSATPVAINLVDSPAAMAKAIEGGQALTYYADVSGTVALLWRDALRWAGPNDGLSVFPTTGPMIRHWPRGTYRTGAYAGERFAASRMLVTPFLQVSSEVGLKEICVYEGTNLFRRFLPNGAKDFSTRLFLSGSLNRNMSVVATDVKGGKAVSNQLRGWNDGSPVAVFCSDHVNDCGGMKLFRGPAWSRSEAIPNVQEPGYMWDGMGGTEAQRPLFGWGPVFPTFQADAGVQAGILCQTPVKELCDDNVWRGRSVSRGQLPPGSPHRNPWSGYGPIEPTPLVDLIGIYTEWAQYQNPTATGYGPMGFSLGPTATLYTQLETFKKNMTLNHTGDFSQSCLAYSWRSGISANVLLVLGRGDRILKARDASARGPRESPGGFNWPLASGDWVAAISPNEANARLWVNRGVPLELYVEPSLARLWEEFPKEGLPVKAGETRTVEWFQAAWPMDKPIAGTDELLRWVRYFQQPDGLELLRGKRLDAPLGVIELTVDNYAAEVKIPRAKDNLDANLPFRVAGFNPRWSAILWQKDGYIGAGRFGKAQNRFRTLAVDFDGRVYFPVYSGQAAQHHLVAGQSVVADAAGKDLFIEVVCLKDAEGSTPPLWHVSVNNPTDQPITAKLTKTMDLPGLTVADMEVTFQPGEYRVLTHPEQ